MLLSLGIAYAIPFELVLLSYAFLGPAHYLTEISWLHDRSYFSGWKWTWVPLAVIGALITFLGLVGSATIGAVFVLLAICLVFSIGMALAPTWQGRIALMTGGCAVMFGLSFLYPPVQMGFVILLPTVIHIYLFTGLFILGGALKSNSKWGYASFAVFVACGLFFVFVTPSITIISQDFVDANLGVFDILTDYLVTLLSFNSSINAHAVLAFLSFAYTYHYLNWFSKTEIIKWHVIPKRRLAVIVVLYLASVGIYLIDYKVGFLVLTFLSLTHVLLELPLNTLSVKMIGASLIEKFVRVPMQKAS